jgi:hypothetical protein
MERLQMMRMTFVMITAVLVVTLVAMVVMVIGWIVFIMKVRDLITITVVGNRNSMVAMRISTMSVHCMKVGLLKLLIRRLWTIVLLLRDMVIVHVIIFGIMRVGTSLGIISLLLFMQGVMIGVRVLTLSHLNVIMPVPISGSNTIGGLVAAVSNTAVQVLVCILMLA